MEILRFIKWQWGEIGTETKQIGLIVISVIMSLIYCWYIGTGILGFVATGIGTLMLMVTFIVFYDETKRAWRKYKKIKEAEAEEIMRKLRGNDGSVTTPGKGFF